MWGRGLLHTALGTLASTCCWHGPALRPAFPEHRGWSASRCLEHMVADFTEPLGQRTACSSAFSVPAPCSSLHKHYFISPANFPTTLCPVVILALQKTKRGLSEGESAVQARWALRGEVGS